MYREIHEISPPHLTHPGWHLLNTHMHRVTGSMGVRCLAQGWRHPSSRQFHQSSLKDAGFRQRQTAIHAHTHSWGDLETSVNLTCMFLDHGRKPGCPERTHTCTRRTCKLHTERAPAGIQTRYFLAVKRQLNTTPPIHYTDLFILFKMENFLNFVQTVESKMVFEAPLMYTHVLLLQKTCYCITSIHPSIFYTPLIRWSGRGGAWAYSSGHRARGGVHPKQVASPSQGHTETNKTNNHTHTQS